MKVIGLTGGIGSGKSTFCALIRKHGIATIDSDQLARQVVAPKTPGLAAVIAEFGTSILQQDGSLNRAALRQQIFADPNDQAPRQKLEAILHPLIQAQTQQQIRGYQQDARYNAPYLLVAIPLLVEGILKTGCKPSYLDEIWVLDCSRETQVARASQRDGASVEQINNILANQASRQQRLTYADKVINNENGLAELEAEITRLLKENIDAQQARPNH
ncbi:dephospho-CoA kinase [Thiosulfatimonas sediminis]|uniref:Dephospho-CoA kinase n=1 Tax=Thiosulfatimonas sediminis TaxID=2675054 RepID=A0A6F8PWI0_9GAMM|nr:dephospho-CoA kinase [Thiosulfatimonas sediminis]BBP46512.1 dephospho-CoA kinase [Thiosulfatimonas sediminis]